MKLEDMQGLPTELPIWQALPALRQALVAHNRAILVAPPGAGKSTLVPLALLQEPWLQGRRILLLEPRRLAARSLAWRLAELSGAALGELVGLRTRDETHVSAHTRIEVVTEALLTRRLQADPELADVGLILFDEFHERSLHAELGLALARDVQQSLREDLRLVLMSATLDDRSLESSFDATLVRSEGRSYPVDLRYEVPPRTQALEQSVAQCVQRAINDESGSVLVFLPGEREIARVTEYLQAAQLPANCSVHPLYGRLDRTAQAAAIAPPATDQRKLVLATPVAETSLTIEAVRVVIDSGLARHPVYDPNVGFGALRTRRVSRDAADQRAGRAGRTQPGVCIRLWSSEEVLEAVRQPELHSADLSGLALNVAAWGSTPPWLEAPPAGAWAQAQELLQQLQLLDERQRITALGKQVVAWGAQARIGRMLAQAHNSEAASMACDLAAMLEADTRQASDTDLQQRWLAWRRSKTTPPWARALDRDAQRWRRRLGVRADKSGPAQEHDAALLFAEAYPDRIALARGAPGEFLLANGRGAKLPAHHPLAHQRMLVVVEVDGGNGHGYDGGRQAQIRSAAALSIEDFHLWAGQRVAWHPVVRFIPRTGAVESREQQKYGALVLQDRPMSQADPELLRLALLEGVRGLGVAQLNWTGAALVLRGRLTWLASRDGSWPACDDASLQSGLDEWLGPWLSGLRRMDQISPGILHDALLARLDGPARKQLDQLAPQALELPSGRRCVLEYNDGQAPVLALRVQDLYGQDQSPVIAGEPVLLHLLSPARRPLAVTRDLASFWRNAWPEVRKQMRGRYPKHPWPERPWESAPPPPRSL